MSLPVPPSTGNPAPASGCPARVNTPLNIFVPCSPVTPCIPGKLVFMGILILLVLVLVIMLTAGGAVAARTSGQKGMIIFVGILSILGILFLGVAYMSVQKPLPPQSGLIPTPASTPSGTQPQPQPKTG